MGHGTRTTQQLVGNHEHSTEYQIRDNGWVTKMAIWGTNISTDTTSIAAMEQALLSWDLVMEGCISRQWRQQQDEYWKTYKTRKLSCRWTTELI